MKTIRYNSEFERLAIEYANKSKGTDAAFMPVGSKHRSEWELVKRCYYDGLLKGAGIAMEATNPVLL